MTNRVRPKTAHPFLSIFSFDWQFTGRVSVHNESHRAQQHPKERVQQAYLAAKVQWHAAVIPNLKTAVDQQPHRQFSQSDQQAAQNRPGDDIHPQYPYPAQHKKAGAAQQKHTAMGASPPEQFQSTIAHTAQIKQQRIFP